MNFFFLYINPEHFIYYPINTGAADLLSAQLNIDRAAAEALLIASDGDMQTAIATLIGYNGGSFGTVDIASLADSEGEKRLRADDPESMRCAKMDKESIGAAETTETAPALPEAASASAESAAPAASADAAGVSVSKVTGLPANATTMVGCCT